MTESNNLHGEVSFPLVGHYCHDGFVVTAEQVPAGLRSLAAFLRRHPEFDPVEYLDIVADDFTAQMILVQTEQVERMEKRKAETENDSQE